MRLIDADEAKLALIASKAKHMAHNEILSADEDEIMGFLDHMKTVDAVPVIRCKDCKHWQCDDSESYCDELGIFDTDMNSYCSYAKRKEEWTK